MAVLNFNRGKVQQQPQQQQMQVVGDNSAKRYENQIVIVIRGINIKDATLINRLSDGGKIFTFRPYRNQQPDEKRGGKDGSMLLEFAVNADKVNEFKQLLPKMVEIFSKSKNHKYSDEFLNSFVSVMEQRIDNAPSFEEINTSRDRMTKNWKELLSTINDPVVRDRILRRSFIYSNDNGEMKGEAVMLSNDNIQRVLMQKPNAIFVTDESTWYRIFKRQIVNRNNYILVVKPLHRWTSKSDRDEACKDKFGKSYDEMKAIYTDKAQRQQLDHVLAKHWSKMQGRALYEYSKVYDVSDTELIDQNDDPWSNLIINNNITGERNKNIASPNGENSMDDGEVMVGMSDDTLQRYRDWLFNKCKNSKIDVGRYMALPVDEAIYHAVFNYAYTNAEKLNQVTDDDRKNLATAVSLGICAYLGIKSDYTPLQISEELARLSWPFFFELIPNESVLSPAKQSTQNAVSMVSEGTESGFGEYLDLLKKAGVKIVNTRKDAVNEFYDRLIRMNNSKYNLLH